MKEIKLNKSIDISYYDLIIIPCNYMMEPIDKYNKLLIDSIGRKQIEKYIEYKYRLKKDNNSINDGEIRIIPGITIRSDIMFIRFPYRVDDDSKAMFMNIYSNMINIIKLNNYNNVLFPRIDPSIYGYYSMEDIRIRLHTIGERKEYYKKLTKN